MKIEEAKDKLHSLAFKDLNTKPDKLRLQDVYAILDQIDQPKPVVPQFVADWYEEHKDNFYLNLHRLAWELIENLDEDDFVPKKALDSDFKRWYHKTETAAQTLNNMHQFGYTVQREKLYTVEILDKTLVKVIKEDGSYFYKMSSYFLDSKMQILRNLTESEIKEADERLWRWKKEV